ncbi:MAG: hypothetical protein K0R51_259 [Cytophagaceae bacterium]|jgi:hypothetical protein|nr:hypothetical protein [Cytophagaceae bacterium]
MGADIILKIKKRKMIAERSGLMKMNSSNQAYF